MVWNWLGTGTWQARCLAAVSRIPWGLLPGAADLHLQDVATGVCTSPPWVVLHTLALVPLLVVLLKAAHRTIARCVRWYAAQRGSAFVRVATRALRDLQTRPHGPHSEPRPRVAHCWARQASINTPVVCCACYRPVLPEHVGGAQCCELCGVVAHVHCAKLVAANCKLVAAPGPVPQHDWRPAGTVVDLLPPVRATDEVSSSVARLLDAQPLGGLQGTGEEAGAGALMLGGGGGGGGSGAASELCLYCAEPCEVGLLAVEPVWRCSCCRRLAHVQCYVDMHPEPFSAATRAALQGQALDADELASSPRAASLDWEGGDPRVGNEPPASKPGPPAGGTSMDSPAGARAGGSGNGGSRRSHDSAPWRQATTHSPNGCKPGGMQQASKVNGSHGSTARRIQSLPNVADHGAAAAAAAAASAAAASPTKCTLGRAASAAQPHATPTPTYGNGNGAAGPWPAGAAPPATRLSSSSHRVAALDACRLHPGALACLILPPTSVQLTVVRASPASPASPTAGGGGAAGPAGRRKLPKALMRAKGWAKAAAAMVSAAHAHGMVQRPCVGPDKWQRFRVERPPPGCTPLLVFINPRSGPQVGDVLRRQLLTLLHPLQVVELPKEDPTAALHCWAYVPNLRVLVVGGDGTAGWVMGAMDTVGRAIAAAGIASWRPPPVALLPLGTGNDLARVLHWGGGLGAIEARGGLQAVLLDVVGATACMALDRWQLAVTALERAARKPSFLTMAARHRAAAAGSPASATTTPPTSAAATPAVTPSSAAHTGAPPALAPLRMPTADGLASPVAVPAGGSGPGLVPAPGGPHETKMLTNYWGIGIDAQCALEFHKMRERYPGWFKSQFGNKMWYTGVGAKDLLARSCVNLSRRLQVVCDGVELRLPDAAQGVLFLNIASYMGGVDLWAGGLPVLPSFTPAGAPPRPQVPPSMSDGVMEVVAVNGAVHLGQLQVGLARCQRLCQCRSAVVTTLQPLPMQVDGEPWMQAPARIEISLKGHATMLRHLDMSSPAARLVAVVGEALDAAQRRGDITHAQRRLLGAELALRLGAIRAA